MIASRSRYASFFKVLGRFMIATFNVDQVFGGFIGRNAISEDIQTITVYKTLN